MHYYIDVIKKYAVFAGRAARKEFWMFFLFHVIILSVLSIIDDAMAGEGQMSASVLSSIYSLAVFVPCLAVGVRRLHDTGRSGWNMLFGLIPFIGAIVLIVFYVLDSQPGTNKYGPNPKGVAQPAAPVEPPVAPPSEPQTPPVA